jgi:sugar phosphate isomerase/epimerase
MRYTRRELLAAGAAALPILRDWPAQAAAAVGRDRLGIVIHSYSVRLAADRAASRGGIADPIAFVEHCHARGAGGVQVDIGAREPAYIDQLRDRLASYGMYLEGSIRLPRDAADVARFSAEVKTAREAGAQILRTVLFTGRRYEQFDSAAAWKAAAERAVRSLDLAVPVAAHLGVRLAVENHKDWRIGELTGILRKIGSPEVGVCVDTGNSIALLEDPYEVVEAFAPWAYTSHLKDMVVAEYGEGFLLAEVPLGDGFLDVKRIVATLRRARPDVRFNLEMITRDPLKVPCLTTRYWATFADVPGKDLARVLALVRRHTPKQPLPHMSAQSREQQLATEDDNVRRSFAYARTHLDL